MILIRDISNDIKCKVKEADRDIHKAIERKLEYPKLANDYYNFSINGLEEVLDLHDSIIGIIEEYKKEEGTPPKTMLDLWDWKHKEILEEVAEIKSLQAFYDNL